MQEIYIEDLTKVLKNKQELEKELEIKITNKGKNIFIEGAPEKEFIAIEVLKAINLGFSTPRALLLKNEGITLQTLNIKDLTKRTDLERVRGRIIGTHGRTLKTLNNLTRCDVSLSDNRIGIIGDCEEMEDAVQSLTSIVKGSKQSNVYARLEKQRKRKRVQNKNLNLKNELD